MSPPPAPPTTPSDFRHVRSVLFVCMGNICRSPLAQGVFEHLAEERGVRKTLTIESCGTGGWHAGEPPDPRTVDVALRNGITLRSFARQLNPKRDSARIDLLLAMDKQNLSEMLGAGCPRDKSRLFLSFAPQEDVRSNPIVPDPYYGGPDGFEAMYRLVRMGSEGLLDAIFGKN